MRKSKGEAIMPLTKKIWVAITVVVILATVIFSARYLFDNKPIYILVDNDNNPNTPAVEELNETKLGVFYYVAYKTFPDCVDPQDWSPNPFSVFGRPPSFRKCLLSFIPTIGG